MPQLNPPEGLDQFDERIREEVEGLIWLGHLEDSFEFCGHRFVIRTLKADEELAASLVAKDYEDTPIGQSKAWSAANVALALVSIDGDENFCPPTGPDPQAYAQARFNWITQKWYPPVIAFIFARYMELVARQLETIEVIKNLSQRGQQVSSSNADSLKEQGLSEENPALETLQHLDSTAPNSSSSPGS